MLARTCLALALLLALPALADEAKKSPTPKELLAKSAPTESRTPDPQNLVYMDLPQGRVIIELAQDWSPLVSGLRLADHLFVLGRGLGLGAAQDGSDSNDQARCRAPSTPKRLSCRPGMSTQYSARSRGCQKGDSPVSDAGAGSGVNSSVGRGVGLDMTGEAGGRPGAMPHPSGVPR